MPHHGRDDIIVASIIGVPIDLGANRRGVDMGPSAIRYANLSNKLTQVQIETYEKGDINVAIPERPPSENGKTTHKNHVTEINRVCELLAEQVFLDITNQQTPIVLGGDHSIAIGSIAGAVRAKGELGVIWIDAHGDLNTFETSPSGNIHGMALSACLGYGFRELTNCNYPGPKLTAKNIVLIATRELDDGERNIIEQTGINVFSMYELDKLGMEKVMTEAITLASQGTNGIHLSLDMDGLDPMEAPGVGTPVKGGINYREAHLAMELLAESNCLTSLEVVEVNPILDEGNRTADLAVELIASSLGKRVL